MHKDLESIVLTREQIAEKVKEAASWLDEKFKDSKPLAISVLLFLRLVARNENAGSARFHDGVVLRLKSPKLGHAQDSYGPCRFGGGARRDTR